MWRSMFVFFQKGGDKKDGKGDKKDGKGKNKLKSIQ